ncbi:MAG: glycosyltransferase family 2 protein [Betaproteobacteria bacterium]|nr:glycosyltransferase family 2 protein [Betaproteobacteria bacterium]MBL8534597.1 glycosyltransferase family 2 protein [Betaproteobacteria bacterium]
MRTTLLVMTLNEIDGMRAIMPQVNRSWCDQIIVVDGGSTDGTIEWSRENGYEVYIQKQRGFRHAYTEVMPLVTGDVIITFSPDGNSIASLIPDLIRTMAQGYDMVIASRYLDGAKSTDDSLVTGFGNWLFTKTVNLLHGGRYTDAMVIFRAYRKELVYKLELDRDDAYSTAEKLFCTKISWEPLLSVRAAKKRLRVTEIPGDEPPRIGGKRKLQVLKWGAAYYFQFLRELFCWR